MWPWSKKKVSLPQAGLRETFFGDMPLPAWATDNQAEPWPAFSKAVASLERGDRHSAIETLQSIVRRRGLESRHYLEAWQGLREIGVAPTAEEAKHVYGVVVDVPMTSGFDTLAAYEDRCARYINFSGAAIIWDAPDTRMDGHIQNLLTAGQALAYLIGPWEGQRPPLAAREGRISLLTPSGLHFGQGPFEALTQDAMAAPVISAATELMQGLIQVAKPSRGPA